MISCGFVQTSYLTAISKRKKRMFMTSRRNYRPVQIQDEFRIRSKSTSVNQTSGQLAQNTICTYTYISIYLYLICLCKGCDRCTVHSKYTEKKVGRQKADAAALRYKCNALESCRGTTTT